MDFSKTLFQIAMTYFQFMDRMWRYKNQWIMTYIYIGFLLEGNLYHCYLLNVILQNQDIITENLFNVFLLKYIYMLLVLQNLNMWPL